ncbi:MAG: hypothetical protein K2W96_16400 [Gemmataceae bacterium]|nr:hypothetical protein [Gemmataceae bacterium]
MSPTLLDLLESDPLSAELNAASGFTQFLRGLDSCAAMERLRQEGEPVEVSARLLHLVDAPFDAAYENPADVAVAALLRYLQEKDEVRSLAAAEAVLGRGRNFWWAAQLAGKVLEAGQTIAPPPLPAQQEAALAARAT